MSVASSASSARIAPAAPAAFAVEDHPPGGVVSPLRMMSFVMPAGTRAAATGVSSEAWWAQCFSAYGDLI